MFLEHHSSRFESQIIFFNFGNKKSEMLKTEMSSMAHWAEAVREENVNNNSIVTYCKFQQDMIII